MQQILSPIKKEKDRFDLHFKTLNWVLDCLITRSKAHTFTWCIAPESSSFSACICSKHWKCNSVSNLHWTEDQLCYNSHHKAEKQHCCTFWPSQQKCYYLLTLDLDQVCTDGWSCRESNEQIRYCWRCSCERSTGAHKERAVLRAFQSKRATTKHYGSLSNLISHIKETRIYKKSTYELTFLFCFKKSFSPLSKFFLLFYFYYCLNYSPTEDI